MSSVELQQMTFNIHKTGQHLPSDVITITPTPDGWVIESDDGLEVWHEIHSSASVALMRAASLVRAYELNGGAFMTDAVIFGNEAEAFLQEQVI